MMELSGTDHAHISLSKDLQERFLEARVELDKQRAEWMKYQVVYTAVKNVLGESETVYGSDDDLSDVLEMLSEAELKSCHGLSPRILGQSEKLLDDAKHEALVAKLGKNLENTSTYLENYHRSICVNEESYQDEKFQLEKKLEKDKSRLESCRQQINAALETETELFASSLKELIECSDVMSKILVKFKFKIQPRKEEAVFENLLMRCDALNLKLQVTAAKLRCELYTTDFVRALSCVRAELLTAKKQKKEETIAATEQIQTYRMIGEDFNKIAAEYAKLKSDIEKQTWCLERLEL